MEEIFIPAIGYDGLYSISNLGRVRRDKQSCGTQIGLILKQCKDKGGYSILILRKNNIKRTWGVHKLVAYSFIGKRPEGYEINHKDGNKENNSIYNLEYVTKSENCQHGNRLGLRYSKKGSDSYLSKLTDEMVINIRKQYKTGKISQRALGKIYGICGSNVSNIINRRTWAHLKQEEKCQTN